MKETFLSVDKHSKFITYGIEVEGELWIIDINFIDNAHFWGLCVAAPIEGEDKVITKTTKHGEELCMELKIDEKTNSNYSIRRR